MTATDSVVGRLGEDFLAQAFRRHHTILPGDADQVRDLLDWNALNTILATHRMEPPRLRLAVRGQTPDQGAYTTPTVTRRSTVWHRLATGDLNKRLAEGATLVVDAIDQIHPPIGELAAELERMFRCSVQTNAYVSWRPESGFQTHWDDHDTVIVQVDGAKRWRVFGPTRQRPLHRDIEAPATPDGEPIAEFTLTAGDVLYVPRGHWHDVSALDGQRSLHLTFGLSVATGADLLGFVADVLRAVPALREDLPVLPGSDEQQRYLETFRKEVAAELERPDLLARYFAAADGLDAGRIGPSLPFIDGIPADPALRVRQLTPRAVLHERDASGQVMFEAAGQSWTFAPAAWGVLEAIADGSWWTLGELARIAGVDVATVADLATELVAHGVVQAGQP
jgi:hypothetical protein